MTEMRVPAEQPENVRPTPDKIAAAVLLKQSLEKLGQAVPPWVGDLAASSPQDNGARVQNGRTAAPVLVEDVEVVHDQHGRDVYVLSAEEAQRVARQVQDVAEEDGTSGADGGPA
jgi:hypothetical protein